MTQKLWKVDDYINLLKARISRCYCIELNDRDLPNKLNKTKSELVIQRGKDTGSKFLKNDPKANSSINLVEGGYIEFYLRLGLGDEDKVVKDINSYSLVFLNLPNNPNKIQSLRYDYNRKSDETDGWDEELGDNPEHPQAHLHINFTGDDNTANNLRLPTGQVYPTLPILILRAFDYWYCETFIN